MRHADGIFRAKVDAAGEAISRVDGVRLRPGDRIIGNPEAARPDVVWRRGASAILPRRTLNERYRERLIHVPPGNCS